MKPRLFLSLLLAAGCAGAEPKERPRLAPPVVAEEQKRDAGRETRLASGNEPATRVHSFDDYLQAQARRPVGLEAAPEIVAARAAAADAEKKELAAGKPASAPARTDTAGGDVLVLPKMEVTAEKLTKLKGQLAALEANQSWEAGSAEAWKTRSESGLALDAILNPPFLRLGSYSGAGRADTARRRVEMLRWVKILTISLEDATTPEEKARIRADIDTITGIMRMWE